MDYPTVRINVVDETTQHTVALFGTGDPASVARAEAFCDTVVRTGSPVVVEDAVTDPRFAHLRSVVDGEIGSYVGVPLRGRESMIIGAV